MAQFQKPRDKLPLHWSDTLPGKKMNISRISSLGECLWGKLKSLLIRLINLTQQVRSPIRWGPTVPSQPRSICPLRKRASLMRSGKRPFRSTEAKQPWKPSRETTSFGRFWYMLGPKPPTKRSPGEAEDANELSCSFTVKLRLAVGFSWIFNWEEWKEGQHYFSHSSPPKTTEHNLLLTCIYATQL